MVDGAMIRTTILRLRRQFVFVDPDAKLVMVSTAMENVAGGNERRDTHPPAATMTGGTPCSAS
jgi:hypothetical protein